MGFRNIFLWIVVGLVFAGCSTSLRSNWKNFNAYYNTFYNAKKSYRAGLEKNVSQSRDYNPLIPIRIHQPPVNTGYEDFERAIQKSADILRKHEDSKWVDDALFLIGRSYYYQQEFYSADQKFDELYLTTQDQDLQIKSILWKSRNYLEMGLNTEGIAYISEQLDSNLDNWKEPQKAELRTLLAEHYVALENWAASEEVLRESVPYLDSQSLKSRGYFLLGQVYEELEIYETAFGVYDRVKDHYSDYRLQYLAQRKKAELARQMGRNDVAADIFNEMLRDDKNVEYLSELDFELARTEHQRGNFERAEMLYNRVLHANNAPVKPVIKARSYNGLAEIHRFGYDDYMKAAVYYDSAAKVNVSRELLPASFNVSELANSFGEYARVKEELSRQDSLLKLGLLPEEELDSVITVLRRQRILELQQQEQQRNREDRLMTVDQSVGQGQEISGRNGFLNTNNPALQESVKRQFDQIWGDRPLTDNWRVQSLISAQLIEEEVSEQQIDNEQTILLDVQIDLSDVPFTENEQDSVRRMISSLQYELGNLMYLSMDMPDSAAYYFRKAIENPSDDRINMVSLYSLSELYENAGDARRSMEYTNRLLQDYPNSSFARELRGESRENMEGDTGQILFEAYTILMDNDSLSVAEKADSLKNLSLTYDDQPRSDLILFESIQLYLKAGTEDSSYVEKLTVWQDLNDTLNSGVKVVDLDLNDSLDISFTDTLLTENDSLDIRKDFRNVFPYQNAAFDSARNTIDTFLEIFPNSSLVDKVNVLREEITFTDNFGNVPEQQETENNRPPQPVDSKDEGYVNCKDIERELSFRSGMSEILSLINERPELGAISIKFRVNHRGLVDSYELLTEEVSNMNSEDLERIINNDLVFDPIIYQARSVPVVCTVTISGDQ